MLRLNYLISSISDTACYYLAIIVNGVPNTDLEGRCARDCVLFLTVAMKDEAYL